MIIISNPKILIAVNKKVWLFYYFKNKLLILSIGLITIMINFNRIKGVKNER